MNAPFSLVFFDVDSTLVTIEGIDVLAADDAAVVELTEAAMNGEVPLEDVYGRRLEIVRPTRAQIEDLGRRYVETLVPGARETIARLRDHGIEVHLLTAGLEPAVLLLAKELRISDRFVHAVGIALDDNGTYRDYDRGSFLTRRGGKAVVIRDIRSRAHGSAAFVGDGMTDVEAADMVELFIGFGGVRIRPEVRERSAVYIEEADLRSVLPWLLREKVQ